ncbi:hypothetical protein LC612_30700 [Nostoc sp. CHAB 5834]|nr:hypothetical protein [Nostoc sp. CHAB 5834]
MTTTTPQLFLQSAICWSRVSALEASRQGLISQQAKEMALSPPPFSQGTNALSGRICQKSKEVQDASEVALKVTSKACAARWGITIGRRLTLKVKGPETYTGVVERLEHLPGSDLLVLCTIAGDSGREVVILDSSNVESVIPLIGGGVSQPFRRLKTVERPS